MVRQLFEAISDRNVAEVEALLHRGVDPDATERGFTGTHAAAHRGDCAVVDLLLRAGADANIRDDFGLTPLSTASRGGHLNVVKALIRGGADIGNHGGDALTEAVMSRHEEIARALIAAGADVNARTRDDAETVLELALMERQEELAEALLAAGADPTGRGYARPLAQAAGRLGRVDLVGRLLEAGADPDSANEYGDTALMAAAAYGNTETAACLIVAGARVDSEERRCGRTALFQAESADMVQLLLDRGADLSRLDAEGKNALTVALSYGHHDSAEALRRAGAEEQPCFELDIREGQREARAHAERREARHAEAESRRAQLEGARPGKVTDGPFANFAGVGVMGEDGEVRVLLEIFGTSQEITVPSSWFVFDE